MVCLAQLNEVIFSTGVLFVAALGVVFVALFAHHVFFDRLRTVHWTLTDDEVRLRQRPATHHHVFLSHAWRSGQDQAKTIKLSIKELLPSAKIYLDVDAALMRGNNASSKSNSARQLLGLIGTSFRRGASPPKAGEADDWMKVNVTNSEVLVVVLSGGRRADGPTSIWRRRYFRA